MSSTGDSSEPPHMTADEFRKAGHALVDWIADYHARVAQLPVKSRLAPGEVRAGLPQTAPRTGESFDTILNDLDDHVVPGLMHWQSPNFFGYFPANTSPPSILGELLSAGLGVQGMLWLTSPACTEIESLMLDWLVDMLGLPERFLSTGPGGGVIQDSASSATLCALLAARERASNYAAAEHGSPDDLVAYCSQDTHSSMDKAMAIAGLGRSRLRKVAVDGELRLDPTALERAMAEDRAAGLRPLFVCATVGTTSSLAIDPVAACALAARRYGAWLHVDAAMAGSAAICPEFRYLNDGLDQADSYCFNPHKWLLTNFDCDCFYVSDREPLTRALSVMPEYLRNTTTEAGAVIDYRDWQIPLGRRFRALKLWFVIRSYGVEGLQRLVRRHVELARLFADWVEGDEDYELLTPPTLNLVCFARRGGDEVNRRLLERLNADGSLFMSHTVINGRYCLRMCIGQTHTSLEHVEAAWSRIRAA